MTGRQQSTGSTSAGRYVCTSCLRRFETRAEGCGHLNPNPSWDGYHFCGGTLVDKRPLLTRLQRSMQENEDILRRLADG